MDRAHLLLAELCEEVERQIKAGIRGPMESVVGGYLPQAWVFETEVGMCTVFIDTEGNARVFPGGDKERDVTIRWRHEALVKVLQARNRDTLEPGDYPDVLVHTDKGRAAFSYLKKYVGL